MSDAGSVAFVGAGQMGLPMVRRLIGAGEDVRVYARRAEVREECITLGAAASADLVETVGGADVVVVCLYSDDQLVELAFGPYGFLAAMASGSLLVTHTTASPATTRRLAEAGATRGLRVVEAPVSGSADDIAAGHVTVLLAGDQEDVDGARDIVAAYGDPIITMGPLGSALGVKLLNNALFAAQVQLAGEVERIAADLGVAMPEVAAAIQRSSGASYAMGLVERFGSVEVLAGAAGHFLAKDVAAVEDAARDLGLDLGVLGVVNRDGPLEFRERSE